VGYFRDPVIIARVLAVAATASAFVAWVIYLRADLVLNHYDARAHLVVARRIFDSLTPGWQQIGAVWLPLPHLLQAVPIQVDAWYRTGASASVVSIVCFGITTYALARIVLLATASRLGASVTAGLLVLNPNLLYVHTTPMTEPLALAAIALVTLWLYEWVPRNEDAVPARLGVALFAAAWTRYEAWVVIAAALAAALHASARVGASRRALVRRASTLGAWPAAAILLFVALSRATTGAWFTTSFYVPDTYYDGQLARALLAVWWGTHQLSTRATEVVALGAAVLVATRALTTREHAPLLVLLAPFAAGMFPAYAFYEGHPFRIRYMLPLVAACALFDGVAVGMMRRHAAVVAAGFLLGITIIQSPPWRQDAPVIVEAQRDRPLREARQLVTVCLMADYRGEKILASMGSLAHYMQELSHTGRVIADFVHEGNGPLWQSALEEPQRHVGWMLVEEQAEGGDLLARRIRQDPEFSRGFIRVCEGGGVALFKRG
jgi:hypothetical protein